LPFLAVILPSNNSKMNSATRLSLSIESSVPDLADIMVIQYGISFSCRIPLKGIRASCLAKAASTPRGLLIGNTLGG
jgi:hypothetical protein